MSHFKKIPLLIGTLMALALVTYIGLTFSPLSMENIGSPIFSTFLAIIAATVLYKAKNKCFDFLDLKHKKTGIIVFSINFIFGVSLLILAIPVLSEFGVPTASLITILGTGSLAIGLALKGFLSNIAAGMMLIFQKPFDVGHLVEISGTTGTVDKIDLFSVRIKTPTNELVHIPNGKLVTDKIINKNSKSKRRLELKIRVDYSSDLKLAKQIILDLSHHDERIFETPAPLVVVDELGEHAVILLVRVWLLGTENLYKVKYDLLENIKTSYDDHNIMIPYQKLDVQMQNS